MKFSVSILTIILFPVFIQAQNVGIGTVTPQAKVHVVPDNAAGILLSAYGVNAGQTSELRFSGITGAGHIALKAPDNTPSPIAFTLPSSLGSNGQVLSTNGSGGLLWANMTQNPSQNGGCCNPSMVSSESPVSLTFAQQMVFCDTLTEGGYNDWVVPTIDQMIWAAGGGIPIPGTRSANYIRTRSLVSSGAFYSIRLLDGDVSFWYGGSTSNVMMCRCVR